MSLAVWRGQEMFCGCSRAVQLLGLSMVRRRLIIKAGVHVKAVFWLLGIMVLMRISRLRFKQSRIPMLITHLCFGQCCKFVGDFSVYLEINSLSERICKIYGSGKF